MHRFKALVARNAARRSALRHLALKLFRGSSAVLLTQMVADADLTDEEMLRIRKALNARIKEDAMILAVMVYALLVGVLLCAAALTAERVMAMLGVARRVWVCGAVGVVCCCPQR